MPKNPISTYLIDIERLFRSDQATEHSYRSSLQTLIQSFSTKIIVVNEPKRIECGAPDFIIKEGQVPLGNIEAKNIGKSLDSIEKDARLKNPKTHDGEQLNRFRESLHNLILTDYLEFRWFVEGEKRLNVRLANIDSDGKIRIDKEGSAAFDDLVNEFLKKRVPSISTPKELATRMAALAKHIRKIIKKAFEIEDKQGNLHIQLKGFKEVLLHSLTPDQFADIYAQTICYGLFTARYNHTGKESFTRQIAAYILPKTNPFLRKLFGQMAGPEMDERIDWAVDELAELLNRTDIGAILKNFGKRMHREDPVVHFYETFLSEYNKKLRKVRGVYYTPKPVVSYIVRSIDHILKNDFALKDGLADKTKIKFGNSSSKDNSNECHKVLVLDPAVGTGTFLFNVIDHIHEAIVKKGQAGTWSEYVSKHLLPRLFGFELLVAPYAVAHMKLDLQLKETKYNFKTDERLNIILTNSLEEAYDLKGLSAFANWIAEEANEAGKVKQDLPVMVVLGNPPYSGHSENKGKWITSLLRGKDNRADSTTENYFEVDGEQIRERQIKWLSDDYVKFIRFAQYRIERTGYGILAFITNHSYLDSPTFRGMRQSLMNTFDDIYVLDLHGNSKKKEVCPDGSKDENVFDIQQGVAIGIYVKRPNGKPSETIVRHKDKWGLREEKEDDKITGGKYFWLSDKNITNTNWENIKPSAPYYLFKPMDDELIVEYDAYNKINDIMTVNNVGFVTARDKFAIDFDKNKLIERISEFREKSDVIANSELSIKYNLKDTTSWKMEGSRNRLRKYKEWKKEFKICLYRPFDLRHIFYSPDILERPVYKIQCHMISGPNLAIAIGRAGQVIGSGLWDVILCSRNITEFNLFRRGGNNLFPLYLYTKSKKQQLFDSGELINSSGGQQVNLAKAFIKEFSENVRMTFITDGAGDLKKTFGPEDIFHYMYAVFHSPTYRIRYAEFLKIDFPRLPLTSKPALFRVLCTSGEKLVGLHLMEKHGLEITTYPVDGNHEIEKVRYTEPKKGTSQGRVWINKTQYFEGVRPEIWEFHIGGYQVCQRWLSYRKGRKLNHDDLMHYQYIASALSETIRIMGEIDKAIDKHGGWPIE